MAEIITIVLCLLILIEASAAASCCCEPSCMRGPACPPPIPIMQPCPQLKCPPVICPKPECPQPLPPICPMISRRQMCPKVKCPNLPMPMPMPCPVINCPPPPPMNCQKCLPELIFSLPPCSPINCPEPPPCPKPECPAPQPCPVITCPPQKPCSESSGSKSCSESPESKPCSDAPGPKSCSSCSSASPSLPLQSAPLTTMNSQSTLPAQLNIAENIDLDLPAPIQTEGAKTKTVHGCSSPGGCGNDIGNSPFTENVGEAGEIDHLAHLPKEKVALNRLKRNVGNLHPNVYEAPCNNEELRRIMNDNLGDDIASSKRNIQSAAEEELTGRYNVICSATEFAYVSHSQIFCQASNPKVTCYAFLAVAPHA